VSYSLLIVDDETIERSGIRHLIETEIPDITDIREASNGVDFIRRVEEQTPDIVILDVDLPGLNGLEALDMIRRKGFVMKSVIHSAHGKFQYAQDAINLAADAYLLKPVRRKVLLDVLRKLIQDIEEKLKNTHENEKLRKIVKELLPIVRSDLIAAVVSGDLEPKQFNTHLQSIGHRFHEGLVLTVRLPDSFFLEAQSAEVLHRAGILDRITLLLEEGARGFSGMIVNRKVPILLFHIDNEDEFHRRIWAIEQAERIRDYLNREFEVSVTVGIGSSVDNLSSLSRSYRESLSALEKTGLKQTIHHYSDTNKFKNNFDPRNISMDLMNNGWPDAENESEWFRNRIGPFNSVDTVKDRILSILFELRRSLLLDEESSFPADLSNRVIFGRLDAAGSEAAVLDAFHLLFRDFQAFHSKNRNPAVHEGVRKARSYIEKNFMRNISLDIVAEEIGISPFYLSHLFKEATGKTYIGYLTEYRINRAVDYINENRFSLAEVASKCGYSSPAYFIKVFKKTNGGTVSEIGGICSVV